MPASSEIGWCDKTPISAFEKAGEGNATLVAVLRPYDLHADGQTFSREPGRCHGRRQIDEAAQPSPEQVVDRRRRLTVDLDHALPAFTLVFVIVRVGSSRCDRA